MVYLILLSSYTFADLAHMRYKASGPKRKSELPSETFALRSLPEVGLSIFNFIIRWKYSFSMLKNVICDSIPRWEASLITILLDVVA